MAIVEAWQKYDPNSLNLKRPDSRLTYDFRPSLREAARMKRTGDYRMRTLAEVTEFDAAWEHDVWTSRAMIDWIEDYLGGLTPEQRQKLERVQEGV